MHRFRLLCVGMIWLAAAGIARAQDAAPPLATQAVPLTASDPQTSGAFGAAIAIDGDTAIVGAPGVSGQSGAVYVLVWDGSAWVEQAKIANPTPTGQDAFGQAVALSGDTALVGAPRADVGARSDAGAAYVFTRSGANWSLQAALTASNSRPGDLFGWAVALEGNTATIGAPHRDSASFSDCGAAYVFTRSGAVWSEAAVLYAPSPTLLVEFGWSLALQGDRLAVGEYQDEGAVTVFSGGGASWSVQATVVPNPYYGQKNFGAAVALDGDTLIVGAPGDQRYFEGSWLLDASAAYVFVWDGAAWDQQARLQPEISAWQDAYRAGFGAALALDDDTLVVGADAHTAAGATGAAHLFGRSGGLWSDDTRLARPETSATFGAAVGLAGERLLIGSPMADLPGAADAGVVYAYRLTPGVDLALAADHAPTEPVEGQALNLRFTATNAGPDHAAGVSLTVTLPAVLLFDSASASQGSGCALSGADVICDLGALAPGEQAAATISAVLGPDTIGTTFSVAASVAAQEPDLDETNNTAIHQVTAAPYRVPPGCYPSEQGVVICTSR